MVRAWTEENGPEVLLESPCIEEEKAYGLWISWDGRRATFRFVEDRNLNELHPNIYAPASIRNTQLLKGGGSGTTVFAGEVFSEKLVWKHGDHKDVGEVFGLAEIEHELLSRSETAAEELRSRIPTFKGIYISPNHIRVRSQELWDVVQRSVVAWSRNPSQDSLHNSIHGNGDAELLFTAYQRRFSVCFGKSCSLDVRKRGTTVLLSQYDIDEGVVSCGFGALADLVLNLRNFQRKHFCKFSIAQSTIGGHNPRTASSLYLSGELRGDTLNSMIDQFIAVLRALQELATEEERDVAKMVRDEVERADATTTADGVSPLANAFVGFSVYKNFHPTKGRLKLTRELGLAMMDGQLMLRPEEELPARAMEEYFLACRSELARLFGLKVPDVRIPLYEIQETWLSLLRDASSTTGVSATHRVWNCGLTDAGIHNMFFSDGRLWLFDLGQPSLQPIPAFLTKFLMSFFHTLGMEETADGTSWVNRFEPSPLGDTIQLTARTKELLENTTEAFALVLDRIVEEMLDGEEAVRQLLVKYVALQLASDCAFCMQRWQTKGGGSPSYDNHQKGLEKWLWRALWDLHICSEVCRHYNNRAAS